MKQKYQISERLREEQLKIIDIQHKKLQKYKSAYKKVQHENSTLKEQVHKYSGKVNVTRATKLKHPKS